MMNMSIDVSELINSDIEAELQQLVQDESSFIGTALMAELPPATPIDTGRARNGWEMTQGPEGVIVQNLVVYIGVLNDGHSKQAPAGFVDNIVDDVATRPGSLGD